VQLKFHDLFINSWRITHYLHLSRTYIIVTLARTTTSTTTTTTAATLTLTQFNCKYCSRIGFALVTLAHTWL